MKNITFEGDSIPKEKLPVPSGWRILVGMIKIEVITEGGIVLPDEYRKGREYLRSVGKVLAVGSECYQHPKFQGGIPMEQRSPVPWVSVGDTVLIGQYAGQTVSVNDGEESQTLKLLNDDEVLAVIPDINVLSL